MFKNYFKKLNSFIIIFHIQKTIKNKNTILFKKICLGIILKVK